MSAFIRFCFSCLFIGFVLGAAYGLLTLSEPQKETAATEKVSQKSSSLSGSYLAARQASMNEDSQASTRYLTEALTYVPEDKELTAQAVRSMLLSGDINSAVRLSREKIALGVESPAVHLILFTDEAKQGNWELAQSHLEKVKAYGLQAVTLPFLQSWVSLARDGKVTAPKSTLSLTHSFYQSFVSYQNALMYDVAGQHDEAATFYEQTLSDISLVPERVILVAMQFYIRQGDTAHATDIYRQFQEAHSENLSIQVMKPEEMVQALLPNAKTPMVATVQDGIAEVMYVMSDLLHGELVDREALVYIRLALSIRPTSSEAHFLLAEILEAAGNTQEALTVYQTILPSDLLYRRAALREAFLLDESKQTQKAIGLLNTLAANESHPGDIYMTLADILRNQNRFAEAAENYTRAIDELETVKPQHWPLFYTRGISYERAGKWDLAEGDLLRALSLQPEQADVKNYLAYSWILMGKNLDKATQMLEQAVQSRPEDGHIVDSLAWAYFITEHYKKALSAIEMAVEIMPHDPTVNDHYGDILWRNKRFNEARYQWRRALAFKPEPKDEAAIERKLLSGLTDQPSAKKTHTASSRAVTAAQP